MSVRAPICDEDDNLGYPDHAAALLASGFGGELHCFGGRGRGSGMGAGSCHPHFSTWQGDGSALTNYENGYYGYGSGRAGGNGGGYKDRGWRGKYALGGGCGEYMRNWRVYYSSAAPVHVLKETFTALVIMGLDYMFRCRELSACKLKEARSALQERQDIVSNEQWEENFLAALRE